MMLGFVTLRQAMGKEQYDIGDKLMDVNSPSIVVLKATSYIL